MTAQDFLCKAPNGDPKLGHSKGPNVILDGGGPGGKGSGFPRLF